VIPYSQYITKELAAFIKKAEGLEIILVDGRPEGISNIVDGQEESELLGATEKCKVVALSELASNLKAQGIFDVQLKTPFMDLTYYHYIKEKYVSERIRT
jgi:hypothetical protein